MTKRMLSLLLALVMTLSLCVPALAADDFAAEAVTEVEEQAPEAPEAPVAPEAEEPAEEPVVDEPAAEEAPEAVADEPEMASILPEDAEDLPYLVALGVVSKEAHWELEKLLKKAAPYKEKVDAGELYVKADYKKIDQEESPAQSFLDAYANAQKCLDAIDGAVVDIDVTTATIKTYMDALKTFLPDADGNPGLLVDSIKTATVNGDEETSSLMNADNIDQLYKALKVGATYQDESGGNNLSPKYTYNYSKGDASRQYPTFSEPNGDTNFETEDMTTSYSSEYITALKNAQTAIKAYKDLLDDGAALAKDYMAVRKTVLETGKMEKAAAQPTETEGAALKTAINAVEAIGKDKYEKKDEAGQYVNKDYYVDYQHDNAGKGELFGSAHSILSSAKALQNDILGLNGLQSGVLRNDVNIAIQDLQDASAMVTRTFKYETQKAVSATQFNVVVSVADIGNAAADGITYGYAVKVNDQWLDVTTGFGIKQDKFTEAKCIQEITSKTVASTRGDATKVTNWALDGDTSVFGNPSPYADKYVGKKIAEIQVMPFDLEDATVVKRSFNKNDKVYIYFYQKNLNTATGTAVWGSSFASQQLTFPQDAYFGPTIKSVKVAYNQVKNSSVTYDPTDPISGSNKTAKIDTLAEAYYVNPSDAAHTGGKITVTAKLTDTFSKISAEGCWYHIFLKDAKGNIIAQANQPADGGWTLSKTFDVNVYAASDRNDITDNLLVGDKGESGITANGMFVQLVTAPAGGGFTTASPHSSVNVTFNPLSKWNYVSVVNDILAEAKALVSTDYDRLSDPDEVLSSQANRPDIKTVTEAFSTINKDITSITSKINDATKANSAANRASVLKDLNELGQVYHYLHPKAVDMSALNALIQSINYLNEDDYTYDSWGKMQDLLDAGGDVDKAMKADPLLQSTIDKATKTLQAAKDALVKEGEVDKTALKAAIAAADALVEADYTAESWAANKAAIDTAKKAAQEVVDNATATQAQVNTALNNLNNAMGQLEKAKPDTPKGPQAPTTNNGTGWVLYEGTWYFFKNGKLVSNYWVGKIDGASQWDSNWYYVGADGKMATGMQYIDDLHGGYGWYFLQPTNTKGEIGKMLTGYQWVGGQYGECYFSKANGSSGKCTWSELLGNWNGTTWVK